MNSIIFSIKNHNTITILLRMDGDLIDQESLTPHLSGKFKNAGGYSPKGAGLTISYGLDMLLIRAIDNIMGRNRIDRLSLNSAVIKGKIDDRALWGMIVKTVRLGLKN